MNRLSILGDAFPIYKGNALERTLSNEVVTLEQDYLTKMLKKVKLFSEAGHTSALL